MELHFLRPYWLLAILPLTYIFLQLRKFSQSNNWQQVCDPHLLPHLLVSSQQVKQTNLLTWLGLSWLFATIALSGPSFVKQQQEIYRLATSRMIVMNLSPSMYTNAGATTRIMRSRFKVLDLLNGMQEGQLGLVVYAGEPHTVVPLTEDNNTIKNLVPILDPSLMPVPGDDLSAALMQAEKLFQQAQTSQGQIILLTDKIGDSQGLEKIIPDLIEKNIQVFILDLSADEINAKALASLAKLTGGESVKMTPTNNDVQQLLKIMNNTLPTGMHQDKKLKAANLWKDQGLWFVVFIIPFALLAFRRGYIA